MNTFIKKCRKEAGITQEKLAEKLGVSVTAVQNWESGRTKIDPDRYATLAELFNVPVEVLIKEFLVEMDVARTNIWPDFLFDNETNVIVDTLHLNLAQQDLFGLLYLYGPESFDEIGGETDSFYENLKKIPYGFIDKVGSIQFMNQASGLHNVLRYVKPEFLMKVLRLNPEAEFNVKKLSKTLICEFIDNGYKITDQDFYDGKEMQETAFYLGASMKKAEIILPVLASIGPVYITNDWESNQIRDDIPEALRTGILEMCGFKNELWKDGYYKDKYTVVYIMHGLEKVTDCKNISPSRKVECWVWEINDKGRKLLEWFEKMENR